MALDSKTPDKDTPEKPTAPEILSWRFPHFLSFAVLTAYFHVLMEWLFYVTKPSFLDLIPWADKIQLLFVSAIPVALFAVVMCAVGFVLAKLFGGIRLVRLHFNPGALSGALVLTATTLLMTDNFTWTLFGFGIATTSDRLSSLYLLMCIATFVVATIWISRIVHAGRYRKVTLLTAMLCLAVTTVLTLDAVHKGASYTRQSAPTGAKTLPNILFFAADGIDADNLAVYGYNRYTTPFLDTLLDESMVVSSAFTTASRTTGATMSMLTGRYPATTKVLYPPHALINEQAFHHLPAILKGLGYRQIQESVRYYADSYDMNLRQGFDAANGRELSDPLDVVPSSIVMGLGSEIYFLEQLWERLKDRILHLLNVRKMNRVYESVTRSFSVYGDPDRDRIDRVIQFMTESEQPFFAHIHLMESHCCSPFNPRARYFSLGHDKQSTENRVDYYDDAIRDSDRELARLVNALKLAGKWKNTILVYSSDHNIEWDVRHRVPLIMRFPGGNHRGTTRENASLLDVAPTILDYLAVPKPDFMEGHSLLSGRINTMQPIFAIGKMQRTHFRQEGEQLARLVGEGPPLYGLTTLVMIICNRWYSLGLEDGRIRQGFVRNHPNPCNHSFPNEVTARQILENHLIERGFIIKQKS